MDTSLDNIQKYFPGNYPYSISLAARKLFFEPSTDIGFRSGFQNLDLFGNNCNEIKYYRARTPYTEAFVVFGMKKEQYVRLLHTQNISKQWNVALNIFRIRSEGFYQRQNCTDNNLSLSSNYTSKNSRYSLLVNGIVSSVKTDENGGVEDDSLFENQLKSNKFYNKKLLSVNLLNARSRRGSREFTVRQSINFGKKTITKDSIPGYIEPRHSLTHTFHAGDNWFVYSDANPDSGFFQNVLFDTVATYDTTHIFSYENIFSWKSYVTQKISAEVSYEQKGIRLRQYFALPKDTFAAADTLMWDNTLRLRVGKELSANSGKGFYWNLGGDYIIGGMHKYELSRFFSLSYLFSGEKKISFEQTDAFQSVPFIYSQYYSNHFVWRNPFDIVYTAKDKLSFSDAKHKLFISASQAKIFNYVYLDSLCRPAITSDSDMVIVNSVSLIKNFRWKHFGFNNHITWQKANISVIHIPEIISKQSIFYEGNWFKGVTHVQLGVDITYFSSYYGDAFMPALGLFYLQDKKEIGNYPYIDFFLNMKIKHARVFFKTEHLNSALMGPYYLAPHYPAPDRAVKLGINWTFYD